MDNSVCPKINEFCYVCGHIVPKIDSHDRKILFTTDFKTAYYHYFDEPDLSDADFTPNTVCTNCYKTLLNWLHKKEAHFSFTKPVIWAKDPTGHDATRCYACINSGVGLTRKKLKNKVYYAAFTGALPLERPAGVEKPKPPSPDVASQWRAESDFTAFTNPTDVHDEDWIPSIIDEGPQVLTQNEMDYVVAKMGLSQRNSEFITSFLKRRKLTQQSVNATSYRKRQADFQTPLTMQICSLTAMIYQDW